MEQRRWIIQPSDTVQAWVLTLSRLHSRRRCGALGLWTGCLGHAGPSGAESVVLGHVLAHSSAFGET